LASLACIRAFEGTPGCPSFGGQRELVPCFEAPGRRIELRVAMAFSWAVRPSAASESRSRASRRGRAPGLSVLRRPAGELSFARQECTPAFSPAMARGALSNAPLRQCRIGLLVGRGLRLGPAWLASGSCVNLAARCAVAQPFHRADILKHAARALGCRSCQTLDPAAHRVLGIVCVSARKSERPSSIRASHRVARGQFRMQLERRHAFCSRVAALGGPGCPSCDGPLTVCRPPGPMAASSAVVASLADRCLGCPSFGGLLTGVHSPAVQATHAASSKSLRPACFR